MGVLSRGIKNAFRNTIRTISITFILGLSIAMALIMFLALQTVNMKIQNVKSSIGNTITVSPAGVRGFEGGGELLTSQNATDLASIDHVAKVIQTTSDRLRLEGSSTVSFGRESTTNDTSTTNLTSPTEPGSFGNRQRRSETGETAATDFAMPIQVTGTNDLGSLESVNASKLDLTSGEKIDPATSENVALVGKDVALSVGQSFRAYNKDITIKGIFDGGNTFSNATIIMPIKTIQLLSGQSDQINSMIVQVDSIDNISLVSNAIKTKLGEDKVDVTSSEDQVKSTITPLENIKSISLYSLFGSLIAGSIIILLTMIMIVRERRREIGVLKAIGSSNGKIMAQFTVESLVLTFMSSILGIILGVIFSNPVLKVLVNNNSSANPSGANLAAGGPGGRAMGAVMRLGNDAGNALRDIHAIVDYRIMLYGLAAAIVIAIIGSAIPSFFIAKVRPAEVMRSE
jgi:putative ABC transport system permease protein